MNTSLARRLGFFALVVYGIGDILGAGIYALVGKVIGLAGMGAWVTFILAAIVAIITGFSYAELTARFPVSAGAAAYVRRAFPGKFVATITGIIVLGTGVASAATVVVAFSNYLQPLLPIPPWIAQLFLIAGVSFLSFWGIQESSRVNFFLTFIEIAGLLAVIIVGAWLISGNSMGEFVSKAGTGLQFPAILSGVTIAFYAYIGFEDLANLAEECKNPTRDLPRAILIAIAVSTVIYILVTLILLATVPAAEMAASNTPLLTNTGLINLIMASRLMYGMAHEGLLPKVIGHVHKGRRTPWVGVSIAGLAVVLLVFTGGLKVLAQTTSLLIIIVFFLVHISLIKVKGSKHPHDGIKFPIFFPILGAVLCMIIMTQFPVGVWLRSTFLVGLALLVWAVQIRPRQIKHY